MSIYLEEKINLLYVFLNNNINNCFIVKNINIKNISIDELRISNGVFSEQLMSQLFVNYQYQFLFEINNELYFKIFTSVYQIIIKISKIRKF